MKAQKNSEAILGAILFYSIIASLFLFSGLLISQNLFAYDQTDIKIGENSGSIVSGNQRRDYLLYVPEGYKKDTALPLVLLFHAVEQSAKQVMGVSDLQKLSDEKKFILVAPEGIHPWLGKDSFSWNYRQGYEGVNDVEFVRDLIREIKSTITINPKKIYATGLSAGAMMSCRLACELSDVIAAIGLVAGFRFPEDCPPTRSVPLIAFQSAEGVTHLSNWVKRNGCIATPKTRKISEDITQLTYSGCKDKSEAIFYRFDSSEHDWPGSSTRAGYKNNKDIDASNLMWDFFEAHPLP